MSRPTVPSKRAVDAQEAAWVADEDRFVLQQAKKKAVIRIKGGRGQAVDWLAVTLALTDPDRNAGGEEWEEVEDLEVVDPESVLEGMTDDAEWMELERGIETYVALETSRSNVEYWNMMKTICRDRRGRSMNGRPTARGVSSVSSDLDKLLAPKSLTELEKLDKQITTKLSSHEPIDTDYWEHLRMSLLTYKARAKLRTVSHSIREARLQGLRRRQAAEASAWQARLEASVSDGQTRGDTQAGWADGREEQRHVLDPEPVLRLRAEDKALQSMGEGEFARRIAEDRRAVRRRGYIPNRTRAGDLIDRDGHEPPTKRSRTDADEPPPPSNSLFDREVARGLGENEEIFEAEEEVTTKNKSLWSHQHRPRKPKYFNRMQKGYEWNKYNQTHYDHDNPPPRVVQGYKFNVFYPDLVEKTRAPTYRIEREGGRRRGQTFAPAGEDDTCLIRFMAGPPYEDVAFRIVDREWDYSAKRERGFKSSFDRGILQLHFQFKKVYYRK